MRLLVLLFILCATVCFITCCNKMAINNQPDAEVSATHFDHSITIDQAISALDAFLESETIETKTSNNKRRIKSITTIKAQNILSRNSSSNNSLFVNTNLMYLVNFDDNRGFAFLAADDRISDRIIAITDQGHLSEDCLNCIIQNRPRTRLSDYVSTIDSLDLLNEEYDDWYVGDCEVNGEGEPRCGNDISFVVNLCADYAENEILSPRPPIFDIGDDELYEIVVSSVHSYSTPVVNPMLSSMVAWKQSVSPYNDQIYSIWQKQYVGCVSLALGKILTYHEYPSPYYINDMLINWSARKKQAPPQILALHAFHGCYIGYL